MKTYSATGLFDKDGRIVSEKPEELGSLIIQAEAKTIASDHETKLVRIEIGAAIRTIAAIRGTSLTEAIIDMDLCKTENRAEKTFLKYCRIAGSETLMRMAENPQISLSVLDEIASCKKPDDIDKKSTFMVKVREEIEEECDRNLTDEGFKPGEEGNGKLIVLGITRNKAVGIIRRNQILMDVVTKPGNGNGPERPGDKAIQSKLLQLVSLMRIVFLPAAECDQWHKKHGLALADTGAKMISLKDELIAAGIIPEDPTSLDPKLIGGISKMVKKPVDKDVPDPAPEPGDEFPEDEPEPEPELQVI